MHYTILLVSVLLGSTLAQPTGPPKTPAKTPKKAPAPKPAPKPYNPCVAAEVIATACKGPKDCLYPNPDSCGNFIQCVPLDLVGNAKPVVMPCPDGLQWNDGKKWCDYPNLSTCPAKKKDDGKKKDGGQKKKGSGGGQKENKLVGYPGY